MHELVPVKPDSPTCDGVSFSTSDAAHDDHRHPPDGAKSKVCRASASPPKHPLPMSSWAGGTAPGHRIGPITARYDGSPDRARATVRTWSLLRGRRVAPLAFLRRRTRSAPRGCPGSPAPPRRAVAGPRASAWTARITTGCAEEFLARGAPDLYLNPYLERSFANLRRRRTDRRTGLHGARDVIGAPARQASDCAVATQAAAALGGFPGTHRRRRVFRSSDGLRARNRENGDRHGFGTSVATRTRFANGSREPSGRTSAIAGKSGSGPLHR